MTVAGVPVPSQRRLVLALGTAQTLAWGSSYYLPAILAQPMAAGFGVSPTLVFGAFSAALVISALLGPAAGRAIDAGQGRTVLASSSLVLAAGLAGLAAAQSFWQLVLAWLVLGAGMGIGLYDAAFSALTAIYGRAARAPITGVTLLAGFASTIGWPISAVLEAEIGWRGACVFWASMHLLLGLPLNWLMIPAGRCSAAAAAATPTAEATPAAPRYAMALLSFVFAATWFVTGAMAAHLPRLLEAAGAHPAEAIAAAALVGPAQVAARVAEFGLLRRFHPLISTRLATIAHPVGAVVLFVAGPAAAPVFTFLHGAGNGVLTIAKGTLPLAIFGPVGYGRRQGILGAPSRMVQAVAPFLFGFLIERLGAGALAISALLSLAALLALGALRAPRPA